MKIPVKQLRDVECPNCKGRGKWTECYEDLIEEGDCGLSEVIKCDRCNETGRLEVEIERCPKCSEELEWNDMEFGFNEETERIFRCLVNQCDK